MQHILPKTPSSIWVVIQHWFALLPKVVYHNWINFILVIILGLMMGYFAQLNTKAGWIVYAVCMVANLYFFSCFLYKADMAFLGRDITYKEELSMMLKRFPRFFLACVVMYVILMVFMVPAFFFIISATTNAALLVFAFIFIALGVWVLFYFIFVTPLIIIDNEKVVFSFKHSAGLVKKNWWRNFFVFLIIGVVVTIIDTLVSGVLNLFPAGLTVEIIYTTVMNVISIIAMTAILLVQFNDLKLRSNLPAQHDRRV